MGQPALEDRLREAELRATRPRLAFHRALDSLGGHRSADEIYERVLAGGEQLSRASVYNSLAALADAGLVLHADAGPGRALYETTTVWHHHAVCRICGQVSDVSCATGSKPCLSTGGDWGQIDEAQIIFRGVCSACAKPARRKQTGKNRQA